MSDKPQIQRPGYEPFIQRHFPAWYAQREAARVGALEATLRGGIATRLTTPWGRSTTIAGGRESDRRSLGNQRDRARRSSRENPIAKSLLGTETDNVVADGLKLQAKTEEEAFNGEAEDRFGAWMETADIRGMLCSSQMQRKMYRSPRRDGDGGVVLVDRNGDSRLQYIPGDMIENPDGGYNPNILSGVEVDEATRPIAFHIRNEDERGRRKFERVPAGNFVWLTPTLEDDDDLAVRGETCFASIFDKLDHLDGTVEGITIAVRMAAVFGLVFKKESAAKDFNSIAGTALDSQGATRKAVTLENGQIVYQGQKDEIVQVQPTQPLPQLPDFIRMLCRIIGAPFEMPLELVLRDMSQVNFASARIALLQYYRACRKRQRWYANRCLSRIYVWWLSREVKRGRFIQRAPEMFWPHEFRPVGWDYTDPVSEAQADLLEMTMGTKTPQMIASERGRDYEEMQIELRTAEALRRLNKLTPLTLSNYTRDAVDPAAQPQPVPPANQGQQ